ncbi:MAG: lipopolysaccharide biosynthesis protein [Sandaracinaceae bacterium]|nr:lipopolysaccharide biosynthesis protein [Sandaracinaceae bacterium]
MKPRVLITGTISLLGSTTGTKAIQLGLIAVATRVLGLEAVGLVFFVESSTMIALRTLDFGFYEVLVRRAARGELSRRTLARAMAMRAGAVVAAIAAAAVVTPLTDPEDATVITGFVVVYGLFFLHETGRAVLVGLEMFARNAALALGTRLVGTGAAVLGMLSGYGIEAWLAGMLLAEVLELVAATAVAMAALPAKTPEAEAPLLREGGPFWVLALLKQVVSQGASVIVGGWLGFADNGVFGVANKVIQGALLAVVSLTYAAYPALARDRTKVIARAHAWVVVGLSGAVAIGVAIGAPLLAPLLGDVDAERAVEVTRWLTLAAFFMAVAQGLDTWLRAKDAERSLVRVAVLEGAVMLGVMVALIPWIGLTGAVVGVTAGAAARLLGVGYVARARIREAAPAQSDAGIQTE